ncbi:unnamed protein product [Tilletia controversa]|uniref:Uncharacterized protein n=3 Tax=Tilletia TaxID=13289 RepID=A0A8X7SUE5_9BASI|nr:hypothetical protein CF336_g5433 [Tilletia laevis]KAE8191047.1 hypothetical protein CF328_g5800 [Tilletia controversa]KAE8253398.1 hypothetical protein A4X03_0g5907 [Tilletia caries]KAE8192191.1 hypothetical protein CF335_g5899 [Tilletia laevis]KAE8242257.1 hypothetical protein A4X06_0g7078 [Tilletia controversa]
MLSTADDVKFFAEAILLAALRTIRSDPSPEKVAENDYMMKCTVSILISHFLPSLPHSDSMQPFLNPMLTTMLARLQTVMTDLERLHRFLRVVLLRTADELS